MEAQMPEEFDPMFGLSPEDRERLNKRAHEPVPYRPSPGPQQPAIPGSVAAQDQGYHAQKQAALARQQAAWAAMDDDERIRHSKAEEHRRRTMASAGVTPADLTESPVPEGQAPATQPAPQPTAAPATAAFCVLKATASVGDHELAQASDRYAPDWTALKKLIADHDGIWKVENFMFPGNTANILGFFGMEGWEMPEDAKKAEFEVIVRNGKVFKTDPE